MFLITLAEKGGGNQQQLTFKKAEVTIGRLAGNDIVLGKGNVSKYHSRIVLKDGKFIIVDMKGSMAASMAAALARRKNKVDPAVEAYSRLQKDIHDRLIEYLDLRRLDMDRLGDEELWRRTEKAIQDILDQMEADGELPEEI